MRKRIKKLLLISILLSLMGCNGNFQKIQDGFQSFDGLIGREQTAISTSIKDAVSDISLLDDFQPDNEDYYSLAFQPKSKDGGFIIKRAGLYKYNSQSYCLHAGTYAPSSGDGYVYAPLNGKQSQIIKNILKKSANHPEIPQHEIQTLIWAILANAKINGMSPEKQRIAGQLLTEEEIFELNGGVVGLIPDAFKSELKKQVPSEVLKVFEAEAKIREIVGRANATYKELEKIAVLTGEAPWGEGSRVVPKGRWSYHPDGYFIRMIPSGYQKILIHVYVPEEFSIKRDHLNRIVAVKDKKGAGLQVVYRDSRGNTSANGVRVYDFEEVQLKNSFGKEKNVKYAQWTIVGRPDGELGAEVLGTDTKERYRELDSVYVHTSKIRTDLNTGANPEYLDDILDLASLYQGFKAFKPESARTTILKAWQYYFCRYNGKCAGNRKLLALNETDRILPMFLAENVERETRINLSGSVAAPGNTSKQRLAVSERDSDQRHEITPTSGSKGKQKLPKPKRQEKKFKNCSEAVNYLRNNLPGDADVQYKPNKLKVIVEQEADGTFRAKTEVGWTLDLKASSMTIPVFSWPNMTEDEKAALNEFYNSLQVHEEGHFEVLERVSQQNSGNQSATGSTRQEAIDNLQDKLNTLRSDAQEAFDNATADYDNVTEHGVKQTKGPEHGYPGGNDVRLNCPAIPTS